MKRLESRHVELLAAEAIAEITASRGGDGGRVLLELMPVFSGNAPGILFRCIMHWKYALEFAIALKDIAEKIRQGIDVVPGTNAAPVMLYFPPLGHFAGQGVRVVFTPEDAERLMHGVTQVAEFATQLAPLDVVRKLR